MLYNLNGKGLLYLAPISAMVLGIIITKSEAATPVVSGSTK